MHYSNLLATGFDLRISYFIYSGFSQQTTFERRTDFCGRCSWHRGQLEEVQTGNSKSRFSFHNYSVHQTVRSSLFYSFFSCFKLFSNNGIWSMKLISLLKLTDSDKNCSYKRDGLWKKSYFFLFESFGFQILNLFFHISLSAVKNTFLHQDILQIDAINILIKL